jgi:antimicrobial peptide system SdpB family protein
MLAAAGEWGVRFACRARLWTNVYGLARSLLALSTAGTLLFNKSPTLFAPVVGPFRLPHCIGVAKLGFFCVFPSGHLELARIIAAIALLVVASGWQPRYTALFHWWLSLSFALAGATLDGGDQLTADLTLLLLPVALTDSRPWHWQSLHVANDKSLAQVLKTLVAASALVVIRLQIAGVYLHAAAAKFRVEEWRDGTALYYWLTNPIVGAHGWVSHLVSAAAQNDIAIPLMTWGTMLIEVLLFMSLVMPKWAWKYVFLIGIVFHSMIAVFFGLTSFSVTMIGALVLYLRPPENEFAGVRHIPPRESSSPATA